MSGRFIAILALVSFLTCGSYTVFLILTEADAKPGLAVEVDIVCVSGGVPFVRAHGKNSYYSADALFWEDDSALYSTTADCVVRRQKP